MKYYDYYEAPLGTLLLIEEDDFLTHVTFGAIEDFETANMCRKDTAFLQTVKIQLAEYFAKDRKDFDLPLAPAGTPFQKQVWNMLCSIPYGETRSYQEIAVLIGNPKGCRAVGMANNKNPISIIIPCHRVIGKNGSLVGYGGGLPVKEWLLEHEQK